MDTTDSKMILAMPVCVEVEGGGGGGGGGKWCVCVCGGDIYRDEHLPCVSS